MRIRLSNLALIGIPVMICIGYFENNFWMVIFGVLAWISFGIYYSVEYDLEIKKWDIELKRRKIK